MLHLHIYIILNFLFYFFNLLLRNFLFGVFKQIKESFILVSMETEDTFGSRSYQEPPWRRHLTKELKDAVRLPSLAQTQKTIWKLRVHARSMLSSLFPPRAPKIKVKVRKEAGAGRSKQTGKQTGAGKVFFRASFPANLVNISCFAVGIPSTTYWKLREVSKSNE